MSDIITDQTIHYVVKDYRRMYNNFWTLVETNQSLHASLEKKEKEVLSLKAKIEELQKEASQPKIPSSLRSILGEMKSQLTSVQSRVDKVMNHVDNTRVLLGYK